jgi:hypothetical protein
MSGVANKDTNAHSITMKQLNSVFCTSFGPEHPEQRYVETLTLSTWASSTYKSTYIKI